MARFRANVKLYALDERANGKRWREIQKGIKERFDVEPPTVRAMQKWEKGLNRVVLSHELMQEAERQMPAAKLEVSQRLVQGLIPLLLEAKDAGQDLELAGWKWFFALLETQLGSAKFEYIISEYLAERTRTKQ
ncbi:MAG: hypothetical protein FJ008_08090 [Chloroflexi bacterium]|nr:hypothetical protein [Chloroflexota bacterium]MBM3175910.1 hypothetical protein [Chloroflexota bacterium]MBM4450515.1 hypothetical protein [Chloroflexota bacterium]